MDLAGSRSSICSLGPSSLNRPGPRTTGELCGLFKFSRFAVMKHLKALEKGGLVVVERRGRERINHLNPVPIQAIYRRWMRPFERLKADRLLRLKAAIEAGKESE